MVSECTIGNLSKENYFKKAKQNSRTEIYNACLKEKNCAWILIQIENYRIAVAKILLVNLKTDQQKLSNVKITQKNIGKNQKSYWKQWDNIKVPDKVVDKAETYLK